MSEYFESLIRSLEALSTADGAEIEQEALAMVVDAREQTATFTPESDVVPGAKPQDYTGEWIKSDLVVDAGGWA